MTLNPLDTAPITDPLPLYRWREGVAAVPLLSAAIAHLDFFTWLSENAATPGGICAQFAIQPRPADVMLTLFTAMGLIMQAGGCFHLSPRAREHLTTGSPWNLAPYFAEMKDAPATLEMLGVLRTGEPVERPPSPRDLRDVLLAPVLAQKLDPGESRALLEIAGGSGLYARALPHLRASIFATDLFTAPWPLDCDVHLLAEILSAHDAAGIRTLLAKSRAALAAGGLLILHDAFINAEKTGPLHIAEYSALMMSTTAGKCYSVREMRGFLSETGFDWREHLPTAIGRSIIVARKI